MFDPTLTPSPVVDLLTTPTPDPAPTLTLDEVEEVEVYSDLAFDALMSDLALVDLYRSTLGIGPHVSSAGIGR